MIGINPCGRFVDFLRRPYSTQCRFFGNSDITVTIKWSPALPDAPAITFPTPFMSRRWQSDEWINYPIGEVWNAPQPFNRAVAQPSATGAHQCGTAEQWMGLTYPPIGPPVTYDANGLPTCCGGPDGTGGVSWGGTAGISARYTNRTYYGVSWSGTATAHVGPAPAYGSGGVSWLGTALVVTTAHVLGEGGIGFLGTAVVHTDDVAEGTGGVSWLGTALVVTTAHVVGEGGVSWLGTAGVSAISVVTGGGGIGFDGTADVPLLSNGGVSWSGTATVVVVPSGPGSTCATALAATSGTTYTETIAAGGQQWFSYRTGLSAPNILMQVTGSTDPALVTAFVWIISHTGTCTGTTISPVITGNGSFSINWGDDYPFWVQVTSAAGGSYSLKTTIS